MVFSSPIFIFLFLPLVLLLYFLWKGTERRNAILLVMSLIFYAWGEGRFVLVMLASILINYYFGLKLSHATLPKSKRCGFSLRSA